MEKHSIKSVHDLIAYEVCNSWFAWLFSDDKMQDIIARYYVKKTKNKLKRYQEFKERMGLI